MALVAKNGKDGDGTTFSLAFEDEGDVDSGGSGTYARRVYNKSLNALFGALADAASATGGLLARVRLIAESIGTSADASNSTGSIQAKLRALITDTFGATADAASSTNSLMSRVRLVATSFTAPTRDTRFSTGVAFNVKGSTGQLISIYCYNKATGVRFLQFFDQTSSTPSGTPLESYAIPPNSSLFLDSSFLGYGGTTFSTGITWAFSTTESTYTAGANSEVTVIVRYR